MVTPVDIPLPSGQPMKGVLATPSGAPATGGWPAVIVLHEVFGITPEMIDVADRFARNGYVALVPHLFSAGPRLLCLVRAMLESSSGRPGATTTYVEAARQWLCDRPDVDGRRLGVIGFCMGGGFALAYATTGRSLVTLPRYAGRAPSSRPTVDGISCMDRRRAASPKGSPRSVWSTMSRCTTKLVTHS